MNTWIIRLLLATVLSSMSVMSRSDATVDVNLTLDAFHAAAARADVEAYLDLLAPDIVFLGSDGSERWQGEAFREFVSANFSEGRGWHYESRQRQVHLGPDGAVAWFDEMLDHARLGECRGTGVLVRQGDSWKVAQYNLSVPIPNGLVLSVVEAIKDDTEGLQPAESSPASADASATGEADVEAPAKRCPRRHKTNRPANC